MAHMTTLRVNGPLRRRAAEVKEEMERQTSSLPQGIVGRLDDKAVVGVPTGQVSVWRDICMWLPIYLRV